MLLLFDLPLLEAASQVEEPALDLSLYKPVIVVDVKVVVAPHQQLNKSERSEPKKQLSALVLDMLLGL